MSDDDRGQRAAEQARLSAELAFLADRIRQLEADYLEDMKTLGVTKVIPLDGVTPDTVEDMVQYIVDYCYRSGDPSLADKWSAAFHAWKHADQELARRTAHEGSELDDVRAAANDALEQFERVDAALKAWLGS
jgi:hypothetical protein